MPIEIFISYRRSVAGGHARFLHRELLQCFDAQRIFFDLATLESGDVFPEEIQRAVRECCVLLALIGPGWATVEHNGKRRLHDPVDFVRNEIALALELRKHVIPVLLDNAPMPSASDLPELLAPLVTRSAHMQGGNKIEYDEGVLRLVQLVARVSGVSAPHAAAARPPQALIADRDKLPVLCNRSSQEDTASAAIRLAVRLARDGGDQRPIALLVHGRPDEEHHAFVECLEGYSFPQLLKSTTFGPGVKFVRINDPLPVELGQAAFDQRLRERLGEALNYGMVDDDAALLRQLQQLKLSTLIAVLSWRASELACDPFIALQRVFGYWSRFPQLGKGVLVGCIVCLKYDRPIATGGWFKRLVGRNGDRAEALRCAIKRSADAYGADPSVMWRVADELPSVTVADLDRWVLKVDRIIGRFSVPEDKLQSIIGGEARPMQAVLPELGKLVAAP